jgi:hypothetical protein
MENDACDLFKAIDQTKDFITDDRTPANDSPFLFYQCTFLKKDRVRNPILPMSGRCAAM